MEEAANAQLEQAWEPADIGPEQPGRQAGLAEERPEQPGRQAGLGQQEGGEPAGEDAGAQEDVGGDAGALEHPGPAAGKSTMCSVMLVDPLLKAVVVLV